jgi:hypothetical protein
MIMVPVAYMIEVAAAFPVRCFEVEFSTGDL